MAVNISIANTMGIANYTQASCRGIIHHERKGESHNPKKVHFHQDAKYKVKAHILSSKEIRDLNTFVYAKISTIIDCHKQKNLATVNKFEALSISGSNEDDKDSNCNVNCTSGEEFDLE
eukprot:10194913-Ditylum_brightwellii.AAC.1